MALYSIVKYSIVKHHKSYLKAMRLAANYARNPDEFNELIADAQKKIEEGAARSMEAVNNGLDILLRMMNAYASGEYRGIPWRTLLIVTAAVIYFVMPIDFLPDLLPLVGLADDVAIIAWTLNYAKKDVDEFLAWEREQKTAAGETTTLELVEPTPDSAAPIEMDLPHTTH